MISYTFLDDLALRRPDLAPIIPNIASAANLIISAYRNKAKVLTCGNGGSCSDADHIVAELMKSFLRERPLPESLKSELRRLGAPTLADMLQFPLRAINLSSHPAISTAFANDVDPLLVFAQLALAYTDPGDVFFAISTSGNAKNVHFAAITAKALGATLVALTGSNGGIMRSSELYDVVIQVPDSLTYIIQEAHIAIYHAICLSVEEKIFSIGV